MTEMALPLVEALQPEVEAWVKQGYSGVTQTTADLLAYWFNRDESMGAMFHPCQRRAIETIIYCHEVLRPSNLSDLFKLLSPQTLVEFPTVKDEVESVPFSKYCLKMATGSGKTWVLIALMVWQYFNRLNGERPGQFSYRFMLVAPGVEVLDRLLDAFKGPRNQVTKLRDRSKADCQMSLFMPPGLRWRDRFNPEVMEPAEIRPNRDLPDGAFIYITNWQQFRLAKEKENLWDQMTGGDVDDQPRGELIADLLSQYPDLVVLNDEAHHVHGKHTAGTEELIWRRFMSVLHERISERHPHAGPFLQLDFSATPFYGSGEKREYFPHIVYDYDLLQAMQDMLVKQIFLEERQPVAGEHLSELDFRAERTEADKGKRGQVKALSPGQKVLIEIGRQRLEQLATEFRDKQIGKKPVLMILCEETTVARLVVDHLATLTDEQGKDYDAQSVMLIHSDMGDADLEKARLRLGEIDDDKNPLRVVVSVLMLREGFDKKNISVIVVLRATEADLLLEQVVGRGLRLMFPGYAYPEFAESKREALDDIRGRRAPRNSLDFVFLVEHPRFREFYLDLIKRGYLIGTGDSSSMVSTGDLIPVEVDSTRISQFNMGWPVQTYEHGPRVDLNRIRLNELRHYPAEFRDLQRLLGSLSVTETHMGTGHSTRTWKLENDYFDFSHFLRTAAHAVAMEGKAAVLTGMQAVIAALIDEYVTHYLFGQSVDFTRPENYRVLNYVLVFDHVVRNIRAAVLRMAEDTQYEIRGTWRRLSDVRKITLRDSYSVVTSRCIYPRLGFPANGGGLERNFISQMLEHSSDVSAYTKLARQHGLTVSYRDTDGVMRDYEVDFLVRTREKMFLVETKADRDLDLPNVGVKAQAAKGWCARINGVTPPSDLRQPPEWEYVVVSESLFSLYRHQNFLVLAQEARLLTDQLIARWEGTLL